MQTLSLPILAIQQKVLFPHLEIPLAISRSSSLKAIEAAVATEDKTIAVLTQKDAAVQEPKSQDLYGVGTKAVIRRMYRTGGAVELIVQGVERIALENMGSTIPYLRGEFRSFPLPPDYSTELEATRRAVLQEAEKIQELLKLETPAPLNQIFAQFSDPLVQIYFLVSLLGLGVGKEQALLESPARLDALRLAHQYLTEELQVLELRDQISRQATSEMTREQREYLLRQQMQAIQKELGEKNPEQADLEALRESLKQADLPEKVQKEIDRELGRLERLPSAAPDHQITRSYLEFVAELPWKKSTADQFDLKEARAILDEDHYGLEEVKDRIIEHLAVLKLNPQANAPILTFVGPPGVGKTSLGESIARALGRKFERISLGGLHDEAELRGHRRTYIGAMPGRILQAIRRAGVSNPLLMLDEVDKLGQDFRGDPAAALMEILDPAQNHAFRDNYLNLDFDLSKVFFLTTANTLETIPAPLLDRMEILSLSGYTEEEKLQIARKYLIPRQIQQAGLPPDLIRIPEETIAAVISQYTREAGLRELERILGRIARKIATRFAQGEKGPFTTSPQDLQDLLGAERFFAERMRQTLPAGVAAGLAWTESGGEVLYVEALLTPHSSGITLTGQLGEVMKESAQAAYSFIRSQAESLGIVEDQLKNFGVHLHVPAGATPKDGPSAGITMAAAIASLYTKEPARGDTAMTGEITLSGLVLPIGGLKEKVLAARRAGIRRILFPKANLKELPKIPEQARAEIEFIAVERLEEVLEAAFSRSLLKSK